MSGVPAAFRNIALRAQTTNSSAVSPAGFPNFTLPQFHTAASSSSALPNFTLPQSQPVQAAVPRVVGTIVGVPRVVGQIESLAPAAQATPQVPFSLPSSSAPSGETQQGAHPSQQLPFVLPASAPLATATTFSTGIPGLPKRGRKGGDSRAEKFSLRMRNLPSGIKSEEIWEAYEYKGLHSITDVYVPPNKPFGFLRFHTEAEGLAALPIKISLHGVTIDLELATGAQRTPGGPRDLASQEEKLHKEMQAQWLEQLRQEKSGRKRDQDQVDKDERDKNRHEKAQHEQQEGVLREQLRQLQGEQQMKLAVLQQQLMQQQGDDQSSQQQMLEVQMQLHQLQQMQLQFEQDQQDGQDAKRARY